MKTSAEQCKKHNRKHDKAVPRHFEQDGTSSRSIGVGESVCESGGFGILAHKQGKFKESAKRKFVVNAIAKGWMCSELTKRISATAFNVRTEDHTVLERLHGRCWGDEELPQQIDFDEYVC